MATEAEAGFIGVGSWVLGTSLLYRTVAGALAISARSQAPLASDPDVVSSLSVWLCGQVRSSEKLSLPWLSDSSSGKSERGALHTTLPS